MILGAAAAVLVALFAGACTSRYGTYLNVKSAPGLAFDRLEFYFGKATDQTIGPSTPHHPASSATAALDAFVAKRLVADTDHEALAGAATKFTYYLPDTSTNRNLGDLVVVVGYRADTPVAIGELRDFTVVSDEVWLYDVPLAAYDPATTETWGRPATDCLRWQDPGGQTVFVVRGDDVDCDDYADGGVDCDPRRYCDGSGGPECAGSVACIEPIAGSRGCSLGGCLNSDHGTDPRACTPTLCLPDVLCDNCIDGDPIADELQCAVEDPQHGQDYFIPVKPSGEPCFPTMTMKLALPGATMCVDPKIDAVVPVNGEPGHFSFAIAPGNGACVITMTSEHSTPPPEFPEYYHLLISVPGPTQGGLRSTYILGLQGQVMGCTDVVEFPPMNDLAVCQ